MVSKVDNCELYNTKFVKISSVETDILKYLNDKINCQKNTKMYERIARTGEIVNLYDVLKTHQPGDPIYTNRIFSPSLIEMPSDEFINSELISYKSIQNFDGPLTTCNICNTVHLLGFIDENISTEINEPSFRIKYTHLYDNPFGNETFLLYKNFIIMNNNAPYMKNHLMLTLANHESGKIKGSQYEILNREVLEDVINLHILIGSNVSMGHNYALSGSEHHFHIHMFINEIDKKPFRYDLFVYSIINHGYNIRRKTDKITFNNLSDSDFDKRVECNYYFNNNSTFVSIFNHSTYGYKGIAISLPLSYVNNEKEKIVYISTIHRFINRIETDGEYTFNVYFPSIINNEFITVVILPQVRLGNRAASIDKPVKSFREVTGFIFNNESLNGTNPGDIDKYNILCEYYRQTINNFIKLDIFTDENIKQLLEDRTTITSIYSNPNLRFILKRNTSYVNTYIEKLLTNFNATSQDQKLIIINSTYGGGKSVIKKNLKKYFNFYEEDKYIHIDVDEFLLSFSSYKNGIKRISDLLKTNILNKRLNTFGSPDLMKYNSTIEDVIKTKLFNQLSLNEYKQIYDYIQYMHIEPTGKTINEYHAEIFSKFRTYTTKMLNDVIDICKLMKYNFVLELGLRPFSNMAEMISGEIPLNNWYYIGYNYNQNTQKFILRNVLKRNIELGRFIDYKTVIESFNQIPLIINDYKMNLLQNNVILIEHGLIMNDIMSLTNEQISKRTLISEIQFNENFNPRCDRTPFQLTNSFDVFNTSCSPKLSQPNPGIQNQNKKI